MASLLSTTNGYDLDEICLPPDFNESKQLLQPIVEYLDHQMINDFEPFTALNPSVENLARYSFDQANQRPIELTHGRVGVINDTGFETDTSAATYAVILIPLHMLSLISTDFGQ